MRILLAEDSERLQRSLAIALQRAGYAVDAATNGNEALWRAQTGAYDVIVLDLMLPGLDGLSILQKLREEGRDTHVLVLTARDTVEDRVLGLKTGADDYLVKPFALEELLARVDALVRRRHAGKNPVLQFDDLILNTTNRTVARGGQPIDLSPREYALLHFLALHPNEVVSRTRIEEAIYDERAEPMSNVVDTAVYSLRKKLDRPDGPSVIQTRRGMGYAFQPPGSAEMKGR